MKRRRFIELGSAATLGLGLPFATTAQPLPYTPNVLLVVVEDLNDWVGVLTGHPQSATPNLDALASSGVLFSNAHCSGPSCNPSRTAMLTGLMPSTSGVYRNADPFNDHFPPDYPTLARHFKWNGWYTIGSGKIHHLTGTAEDEWHERYIEEDTDHLKGRDPYLPGHPFNGTNWASIDGDSYMNWGPGDVAVEDMADFKRVNYLTNWLQNNLQEPFFMVLGTSGTHYPSVVPRKYLERFNLENIILPEVDLDDLDDVPAGAMELAKPWLFANVRRHKQWRRAVQAYLAHISFVDEQIGRLLDVVNTSPYANRTIIILTADHGFHLGEKTHWLKFTLWEEATHVYLAMRVPELTHAGDVCSEAVSLLDIYPTLCVLANNPASTPLEGLSLDPQLIDPATPRLTPAITTADEGNHSVRTQRWRYIRYYDGGEELYDHDADPNEWVNLANDPEYDAIKAQLAGWIPADGVPE